MKLGWRHIWTDSNESGDLESLTSAEPPFSVDTALPALSEEVSLPLLEGPVKAPP